MEREIIKMLPELTKKTGKTGKTWTYVISVILLIIFPWFINPINNKISAFEKKITDIESQIVILDRKIESQMATLERKIENQIITLERKIENQIIVQNRKSEYHTENKIDEIEKRITIFFHDIYQNLNKKINFIEEFLSDSKE